MTSLTHLGVTETRQYNVLGQMTRLTKPGLIDVEYRFSATANDGKIVSQKNWLTGEDVVYQYDELERLIAASTTSSTAWGLSWQYDGFGNRLSQNVTQGTGPSNVVLVNAITNRISSAGYGYDSNGNMTLMPKGSGSMVMNYDLSNRMSSVSHPDGAESYVYAPDNRRVWRSAGRTACYAGRGNDQQYYWGGFGEDRREQLIFYSPGGQKMGVYCVNFSDNMQYAAYTASEENVYYGGRLVAKRLMWGAGGSGTQVTDFTTDRLQSKGDGSKFYPYGESRTSASGDDREQFATYTRDEKSGLDYADQRWYASGVGRFSSVDPKPISFSIVHPQSANRYTYALNQPLDLVDPEGESPQGLVALLGQLFYPTPPVTVEGADPGKVTILGLFSGAVQTPPHADIPLAADYSNYSAAEAAHRNCIEQGNSTLQAHRTSFLADASDRATIGVADSFSAFVASVAGKLARGALSTEEIAVTIAAMGGGAVGTATLAFVGAVVVASEYIIRNELVGEKALQYFYDRVIYSTSLTLLQDQCWKTFLEPWHLDKNYGTNFNY